MHSALPQRPRGQVGIERQPAFCLGVGLCLCRGRGTFFHLAQRGFSWPMLHLSREGTFSLLILVRLAWQSPAYQLSLVQASSGGLLVCVVSAGVHAGTATTVQTFTPTPTNCSLCVLQSSASLHVTSPAEASYQQELRAVGWPPASTSGWKEQTLCHLPCCVGQDQGSSFGRIVATQNKIKGHTQS